MATPSNKFLIFVAERSEPISLNGCLEYLSESLEQVVFSQPQYDTYRVLLYNYAIAKDSKTIKINQEQTLRPDFKTARSEVPRVLKESTTYEGPSCVSRGISTFINEFAGQLRGGNAPFKKDSIIRIVFLTYPYEIDFATGKAEIFRAVYNLRHEFSGSSIEFSLVNLHPEGKDELGLNDLFGPSSSDPAANTRAVYALRQKLDAIRRRDSIMDQTGPELERRISMLLNMGGGGRRNDDEILRLVDAVDEVNANLKLAGEGVDRVSDDVGYLLENVERVKREHDFSAQAQQTTTSKELTGQMEALKLMIMEVLELKSRLMGKYAYFAQLSENSAALKTSLAIPLNDEQLRRVDNRLKELSR